MSAERIPVQNIYFLLCYAWNHLQEAQYVANRTENCDRIWDLLTKVLTRSAQQLVKRGLHRDYVLVCEQRTRPRGKVLYSEEIRRPVFGSLLRTCEFDELSADVLPNCIIATTLNLLRRYPELDAMIREECREVAGFFSEFGTLRLESRHFRQVQLHRNMRHYRFVLDVCAFIHGQRLPTRDEGTSRFRDFLRDEASMGTLFEQFVRNFYAKEQHTYRVSASHIAWDLDEARSSEGGIRLLPTMKTDICLNSPDDKVIIDCKFYSDAFQRSHDRTKFISGHLYQLFSYLKNQEKQPGWERVRGMLLYPTVDAQFDEIVHLHGHNVRLVTLNLKQDWQRVSADLLGLLPERRPPIALTEVT